LPKAEIKVTLKLVPYDSRAVANSFLGLAERERKTLDPMKLQKLVYFAHGWNLAINQAPLIGDSIEAWPYGPVIPTLYHEFKEFGRGPITRKAICVAYGPGNAITLETPEVPEGPDLDVISTIWSTYGELSAIQLSNMTHAAGTPWEKVWNNNGGRKNVHIPDQLIEEYFAAELDAAA
jgi:uncharacterized phage-associated protein